MPKEETTGQLFDNQEERESTPVSRVPSVNLYHANGRYGSFEQDKVIHCFVSVDRESLLGSSY